LNWSELRINLIHDWLTGLRGGEKCLDVLARAWPHARLNTLIHRLGKTTPAIDALNPQTPWLGKLPSVHRYYRYLLPILPSVADRSWNLRETDLVVSFSHCVAKGARAPRGVPHVSYCFTPMRYAWQMRGEYFASKGLLGGIRDHLLDRVRAWDLASAERVTHIIAISNTIQQRIRDCYNRDSVVIYPPVDTDYYTPANPGEEPPVREDFYLVVSALAPYKKVDHAIKACARLGRQLVVIGSGQDAARLGRIAGPSTRMLGWQSDAQIRDHLRRCKALLFPGEEDFGIVPLEAQACGAPVVALGRGGATETVVPSTGVLYPEPTENGLVEAILEFEKQQLDFDPSAARVQALRFTTERYRRELLNYLASVTDSVQRTQ
jgi:glycosyltransferase involved in cell wall biosynthesis